MLPSLHFWGAASPFHCFLRDCELEHLAPPQPQGGQVISLSSAPSPGQQGPKAGPCAQASPSELLSELIYGLWTLGMKKPFSRDC